MTSSNPTLDPPPRAGLHCRATLASQTDLDGFRAAARGLLAAGVEPELVHWRVDGQAAGDLALASAAPTADAGDATTPPPAAVAATAKPDRDTPTAAAASSAEPGEPPTAAGDAPVRVPAAFVALCGEVVLHRDPQRFGLLYRLLWRLAHEPSLRHDPLDADLLQAQAMAQAVRRDIHKMRAFVRFRPVDDGGGAPLHVAWFEPEHHIVAANAPFFARRFTTMRWAILTPKCSLQWDGAALHVGPAAARADAPPADAGEALWLTYYRSIFNPARLKMDAMRKEMPQRYWKNLPEAALIGSLAAEANPRGAAMIERAPTLPMRRIVSTTASAFPDPSGTSEPADSRDPPNPPAAEQAPHDDSWQALRQRAAGCTECPLGALATQTVWGEGPLRPALMLVGEQPGDREDIAGRPFVGPAGQLLARAMAELGWDRSQVYVTNAVKHFKYELRGKRRIHKTPAQREADACLHWLESEIAAVAPQAIVALGATAARQLLGRAVPVLRERGQWLTRADGRRVLVTLHPSALLRGDPAEMQSAYAAWLADLRQATRTSADR